MNTTENVSTASGLIFNEVLFGLAILAFVLLLIIEKANPYRQFPTKIYKESFVTNTEAFLINK
jgi:hypothetical protein